ncbi:MAG: flagellar hook basal-body protein, partial [Acidobacteriaceae bacterium]|nr:flagellar hook basal-body protein [Acidobacteriaceae bacterium]
MPHALSVFATETEEIGLFLGIFRLARDLLILWRNRRRPNAQQNTVLLATHPTPFRRNRLLTAFNTALSGLNAESTAVSVVGNNLANLNTTGYKTTTVSFDDVMSQTLTADGSTQLGMGVKNPVTMRNFTQQGAIQSTSNSLDVAVQGQGFLIDKGASGATQYTRAGNLQVNSTGQLENSEGEAIQGWTSLSGNVTTNAPIGNIVIPTGTL